MVSQALDTLLQFGEGRIDTADNVPTTMFFQQPKSVAENQPFLGRNTIDDQLARVRHKRDVAVVDAIRVTRERRFPFRRRKVPTRVR